MVLHCPLLVTLSNCIHFQGVSLQTGIFFVTALRATANSRVSESGSQCDQTSVTFISYSGDESNLFIKSSISSQGVQRGIGGKMYSGFFQVSRVFFSLELSAAALRLRDGVSR